MQDFRNLSVWSKAHNLTLDVYRLTETFPRSEVFGLASQIRRACCSIATNLAEGCGRTQPEFGRFLQIAFGSACEVEYQLLLARDLGFPDSQTYEEVNKNVVEVKRMLSSLLRRIQRDIKHGSTATVVVGASGNALGRGDLAES